MREAWALMCLTMPVLWFPARMGLLGSDAQKGAKAVQGPLSFVIAVLGVLILFGTLGTPSKS
jgi:hypothetical protein